MISYCNNVLVKWWEQWMSTQLWLSLKALQNVQIRGASCPKIDWPKPPSSVLLSPVNEISQCDAKQSHTPTERWTRRQTEWQTDWSLRVHFAIKCFRLPFFFFFLFFFFLFYSINCYVIQVKQKTIFCATIQLKLGNFNDRLTETATIKTNQRK